MQNFFAPKSKASKSEGDDLGQDKKCIPWVEKYRPRGLDAVCAQEEAVSMLKSVLTKGDELPNLLFYGPPGTGKTSTIIACARDLFGNLYSERILELNASDERGIDVVRHKVKEFAQKTANSSRSDGKKCPNYKLIILDEADSMTKSAQEALRRTMEVYSKTTRFCLLCNYVSRIIDPITSRTAKFRFRLLPSEIQRRQIDMIVEKESVNISQNGIDKLIEVAGGDMRRAITYLQSLHRLNPDEIVPNDVFEIAAMCDDEKVDGIIKAAQEISFDKMITKAKELLLDGYPACQFFSQLLDKIVSDEMIPDSKKIPIIEQIGQADYALNDGADEELQMMAVCSVMFRQFQ
jgi:replication factor C subunit 2/4